MRGCPAKRIATALMGYLGEVGFGTSALLKTSRPRQHGIGIDWGYEVWTFTVWYRQREPADFERKMVRLVFDPKTCNAIVFETGGQDDHVLKLDVEKAIAVAIPEMALGR